MVAGGKRREGRRQLLRPRGLAQERRHASQGARRGSTRESAGGGGHLSRNAATRRSRLADGRSEHPVTRVPRMGVGAYFLKRPTNSVPSNTSSEEILRRSISCSASSTRVPTGTWAGSRDIRSAARW